MTSDIRYELDACIFRFEKGATTCLDHRKVVLRTLWMKSPNACSSFILVTYLHIWFIFNCRCYSTHSQVSDRQEGHPAGTMNEFARRWLFV